ncbi:MAG: ferredoxin family protein [Bryobacterales bacterium]|nr:ferredoxin family protein [Acidobacteriota bacterium]MCB9383581.1 ferredoxin family protein [Bryobacterales bacterium]
MKGGLNLPVLRVALYEGAGARPLESAQRLALTQSLLDKGYRVTRVSQGAAPPAAADGNALAVLGRFEQAFPEQAGDADQPVFFRDVDGMSAEEAVTMVEELCKQRGLHEPGGWKPWFPVIDYDRCTNCMQCLSFCLFDVYGVSQDGKIQVQNNDNCKTDCPACSRVCPEVAILFPKYRHGPIHGGEVSSDDIRRESMKVDISALLGGDIYQALRDRSAKAKSRFSKERDEDRALKERKRCLTKLQQDLDIPAEVFASLPSLDEIQEKAKLARERAAVAVNGAGGKG